jgi:hypothetical protein
MTQDVNTKIRPDGLRYESKAGGTEFPGPFGSTMSCFQCGRHVVRTRLASFVVGGTRQYRCRSGC